MSEIDNIDLKVIQEKLYQKLKPSGWGDKLKGFILSNDMFKILDTLYQESLDGKKFTPKLKQLFRAFEECSYDKLKLIIIAQDPYPFLTDRGATIADGIPMSCANSWRAQPSLDYMHKDIMYHVYPLMPYTPPMDLKVWSNQGVLLLNIALTTTVGKSGVHYLLWRPFIVYLLDILAWTNPGLVYCYLGKKAQEYMKVTPDNNYKITATHPAYAAHQKADLWDSGNVFTRINETLIKQNKSIIKW